MSACRLRVFGFVATLLVAAGPGTAQTAEELAFARTLLAELQDNSFAADREYCGMIGIDADGRLVASRPRRGSVDSCTPRDPRDAVEIIASFHTHGSFAYDYDSEVPSVADVEGDMFEGVDGYISTPGGRLWFVDGQTGVSRVICGLGCLPADPDFEAEVWGPVAPRYTLEALEQREAEAW